MPDSGYGSVHVDDISMTLLGLCAESASLFNVMLGTLPLLVGYGVGEENITTDLYGVVVFWNNDAVAST